MEESAYLTAVAAGTFYLIASGRLLRLSQRTGGRPELLLGIYFAFTGQWYVFYNAPYFLGLEALPPLIEHGIEWIYIVGIISYLLFIRSAFRPKSTWATGMVIVSVAFLVVGAATTSLSGDFDITLGNPGFVIQWLGYTVPCVWICWESVLSHAGAKKRSRIGLCDPVVANRYLLFAFFGLFQIAACAAELIWAYENAAQGAVSFVSDALLGGSEIASVAMLWLAFFPLTFYRNWITRRAVILPTPMGD